MARATTSSTLSRGRLSSPLNATSHLHTLMVRLQTIQTGQTSVQINGLIKNTNEKTLSRVSEGIARLSLICIKHLSILLYTSRRQTVRKLELQTSRLFAHQVFAQVTYKSVLSLQVSGLPEIKANGPTVRDNPWHCQVLVLFQEQFIQSR